MTREPTEMEELVAKAISGFGLGEDRLHVARAAIRAMREATPEMLTPIAQLCAPDDLPDTIAEHPRRLEQAVNAVIKAWGAAIDAASPEDK